MEKFSKFNDPRTGVNPFTVPDFSPTVLGAIGGLCIAAVRLPIFIIVAACVVASDAISTKLPIASIRNAIKASVTRPLCKLLLIVLGVWKVDEVYVNRQSLRIRPSKSATSNTVRRGDILVCNRSSYLDVLVLAARFAPTFCVSTSAGGLREVPLTEALMSSLSSVKQPAEGETDTKLKLTVEGTLLRSLSSPFRRPLVIFPEGAPTNNRAILQFTPVLEQVAEAISGPPSTSTSSQLPRVPTVHVLVFKYSCAPPPTGIPCVYVTGNPWKHAFRLLSGPSHAVSVLRLPEGLEPQPADFSSSGGVGVVGASSAAAAVSATGGGGGTGGTRAGLSTSAVPAQQQQQQQLRRRDGGAGLHATSTTHTGVTSPSVVSENDRAVDAATAAAPSTWPSAIRDAMTQLLRGSRAVELGKADYDAYCVFYEQWRKGRS